MGFFDNILSDEQIKQLEYNGLVVEDRYVKDLLVEILAELKKLNAKETEREE